MFLRDKLKIGLDMDIVDEADKVMRDTYIDKNVRAAPSSGRHRNNRRTDGRTK